MGHESVEIIGQETHRQIKIDFDDHRRRDPIEMKKFDRFPDGFFDQPPPSIYLDDLGHGFFNIIGDDDGWLCLAMPRDDDLSDVLIIPSQKDGLIMHPEGLLLMSRPLHAYGFPSGFGQLSDAIDHLFSPPTDGQKEHPIIIQTRSIFIAREWAIKHHITQRMGNPFFQSVNI